MCAVYWPEPVGELWHGLFGNAPIKAGPPSAVLSSGEIVLL